jgi:SNF2 family DNA or RNA helicase
MKRSKPNQQEDGSRQSTLQSSISKISWCIHGRQIYLDGFLAKQMHPHQIGGVRFMLSALLPPAADVGEIKEDVDADGQTAGCILADEMGLGKTLQAIALIWILHSTIMRV